MTTAQLDHIAPHYSADEQIEEAGKLVSEALKKTAVEAWSKTEPAWIPWAGGECPVSMNCRRLEVRFRDGEEYLTDGAYGFVWTHSGARGDIVAYRVLEG